MTVDGTGTDNTLAVQVGTQASFDNGAITLPQNPPSGNRGVYVSGGGASVTRTTIVADVGLDMSANGTTVTLDRNKIQARSQGATVDGGTIVITNSLIDLWTVYNNGVGLDANNNNGTTPKTIDARHVTIVGGGAGSIGARARASAAGAAQQSTLTLRDSVISDPQQSVVGEAGNSGGGLGQSVATVTTDYSNCPAGTYTPGSSWTTRSAGRRSLSRDRMQAAR